MGYNIHDNSNRRSRSYQISGSLMRQHLPEITNNHPHWLEIADTARSLNYYSNGLVDRTQAVTPLQTFFSIARRTAYRNDFPKHVYDHLINMLNRGSAIHKIRNHFTTIAYLCAKGHSRTISAYLTSFVERNAHEIVTLDYRHIDDWERAVQSLMKYAPPSAALNELSRAQNRLRYPTQIRRPYSPPYYPSSSNYGMPTLYRGRSPTRTTPRYRSRTMPPMFYPAPQIAPPNYLALPASRGIMSGFPSPSVFAQDPWEAELDDIREHQMCLEDAVNQLQLNQQDLEEEVVMQQQQQQQQIGGYGQLQISY